MFFEMFVYVWSVYIIIWGKAINEGKTVACFYALDTGYLQDMRCRIRRTDCETRVHLLLPSIRYWGKIYYIFGTFSEGILNMCFGLIVLKLVGTSKNWNSRVKFRKIFSLFISVLKLKCYIRKLKTKLLLECFIWNVSLYIFWISITWEVNANSANHWLCITERVLY